MDSWDAMCQDVVKALQMAEVEDDVRKMFMAMVPDSIGTPKDERHGYQAEVVDMMERLLKRVESRLTDRVAERQTELDGVMSEKSSLQRAHDVAQGELNAKLGEVEERRRVQSGRKSECDELAAALSKAQEAQQAAAAAVLDAAQLRERCEAAIAGPLAALQLGSWDSLAQAKAYIDELVRLGRDCDFDRSLITGFPLAAEKLPEERGTFDIMIMQQCEVQLQKTADDDAGLLPLREAAKADRAVEVANSEAALAVAQGEQQAAVEATAAALAQVAELTKRDQIARKAVHDVGPRLKKAQDIRLRADAELEAFVVGHLANFEALRDRVADVEAAVGAA